MDGKYAYSYASQSYKSIDYSQLKTENLNAPCETSRLLNHRANRLSLDFLTDAGFNSLVFLFGNLLTHPSIGRVATKDIGIKDGDRCKDNGDNFSKQVIKGPRDGCHE